MLTRIVPVVPLLLAVCVQPQEPQPAPQTKKILKREVDGLIRLMRSGARDDGALGTGTCRGTAQVLVAAGYSHRFYHAGDGPWVRKGISALFRGRQGDGSFRNGADDDAVKTTRWVVAALAVLDPKSFAEDIAAANKFLAGSDAEAGSPFEQRLAALDRRIAAASERIPAIEATAGKILATMPRGYPMHDDGSPDMAAATQALLGLVACQFLAREGPRAAAPVAARAPTWLPAQQKAFAFLLKQQKNGVFFVVHGDREFPDVGLTGIGLAALQTKPVPLRSADEQKLIANGVDWLLGQQDKDGAFGRDNVNYSTCSSVMAISKAHRDSPSTRYRESLDKAQRYILFLQNVEDRGYSSGDRDYGSIGYGGDERGDLSNLQFALQALHETGLEDGHESFAKALRFLQRTQNLRKTNDFKARTRSPEDGKWQDVAPGNDGGSAYYPGNSPAGYVELPDGTVVPRSYGSMTYALLKAYILCGLKGDDPRVQAAVGWIQKNWGLDVNPGVDPRLGRKAAYQGLYYYYMVMAQALDAAGMDTLNAIKSGETSDTSENIDWRRALSAHLLKLQRDDGSWVNAQNSRWWEGLPLVCTVYSMLALDRCAQR